MGAAPRPPQRGKRLNMHLPHRVQASRIPVNPVVEGVRKGNAAGFRQSDAHLLATPIACLSRNDATRASERRSGDSSAVARSTVFITLDGFNLTAGLLVVICFLRSGYRHQRSRFSGGAAAAASGRHKGSTPLRRAGPTCSAPAPPKEPRTAPLSRHRDRW